MYSFPLSDRCILPNAIPVTMEKFYKRKASYSKGICLTLLNPEFSKLIWFGDPYFPITLAEFW